MSGLKLFVWDNPERIPFGGTVCFAVGESVEHARAVLLNSETYQFGMGCGSARPENAAFIARDPDRILDLPAGEWHGWSE